MLSSLPAASIIIIVLLPSIKIFFSTLSNGSAVPLSFVWFLKNVNCGWRQLYQPGRCSPPHVRGDSAASRSVQSQDKPTTPFGKGAQGVHIHVGLRSLFTWELWGLEICVDDIWKSLSPYGLSGKVKLHLSNIYFLSFFFFFPLLNSFLLVLQPSTFHAFMLNSEIKRIRKC